MDMYMWLLIFIPIFIVLFSNEPNKNESSKLRNQENKIKKQLTPEEQKKYAVARLANTLKNLSDEMRP
ncbi:hypothetical protein ACMGE9_09840 [Macrococcus sp. EM39E]|uniref:hypothetical protein n=2 Tax=Macrococcus animalis TaxID=3395467 RepID=UPI0039BE82AA